MLEKIIPLLSIERMLLWTCRMRLKHFLFNREPTTIIHRIRAKAFATFTAVHNGKLCVRCGVSGYEQIYLVNSGKCRSIVCWCRTHVQQTARHHHQQQPASYRSFAIQNIYSVYCWHSTLSVVGSVHSVLPASRFDPIFSTYVIRRFVWQQR